MNDEIKTNAVYNRILGNANKLENIQNNLDSVIDFFLAPLVKLYSALCHDCLKLLFDSEFKLDHFRKTEELVWRRIYHVIHRFHKTKRQPVREQDECLIEAHFVSGIGFYSGLIVKLRSHYKLNDARDIVAPLNLALSPFENAILGKQSPQRNDTDSTYLDDLEKAVNDSAQQWARQAIYRSLVYMGDLARYSLEISQFDYRKLSFEFYRSALKYQPDYGLPFNQLATLAGGSNHNLDAVCNYMRCSLKAKSFEGAEGNMRKIFDLNSKLFGEIRQEQIESASDVLASTDPVQASESLVRSVIVTYIKLISDLWLGLSGETSDNLQESIKDETSRFFQLLNEALELEPIVPLANCPRYEHEFRPVSGGSSQLEKPRYITSTIMYEICCISLMLIAKLQKQLSMREPVNHTMSSTTLTDLLNTVALNLLHHATTKCQEIITSKLRELRLEETALSTIDALDISSEMSDLINLDSGSDEESNRNGSESIYAFAYNQTYLPTVKIYFDWLISNGAMIDSNMRSFQNYCVKVTEMVGLLNDLKTMAEMTNSGKTSPVYRHVFDGPEWTQKYPLSCDYPLMGLGLFESVHKLNIDFTHPKELDESEAGFVTIQCIVAFSQALSAYLHNKTSQ